MPPQPSASSSRALNAILPLIAQGQAYEAHQKARTFASRYQKSGQHDTAIDVLFQSARELLKAGQIGSGADLTSFLIDVYDAKPEPVTEESRGRLTQLIALTGPQGSWRKTMIDKSIAWSAKHGPYPAGDPDLQHYVGELLYKEGVYDGAEPHLLAAGKRDSARTLAHVYFDWARATDSLSSHAGDFALRGTIPYLVNGNILAARVFLSAYISLLPDTITGANGTSLPLTAKASGEQDEVLYVRGQPLLTFSQLAVRTCQRAQGEHNKIAREAWVRLCGTFQSRGGVLAAPEVRQALNEIATAYFAIPPPRSQNANPFEMLSSMFGGGAPGAGSAAQQPRRIVAPGAGGGSVGLD
ncbi:cytoplasmic protein [Dentipellis sp. KUC8613]|nr:cytoplasmic protein [Dentipellis sp. KUC8613]